MNDTPVGRAHGVRLLVPSDAQVGEGPVFDPRSGYLCWVDLTAGLLLQTDVAGVSTVSCWELGEMVGAVAPRRTRAGFAVAVERGFGFVVDGELEISDPVLPNPRMRMNDAKCDPLGRLWAGSNEMSFEPGLGSLHRWNGSEPSQVMRSGLTLPNGLGWSADAETMFLVDSMTGMIMRAAFDAGRGEVGEFRPLVHVATGLPDGLAVDMDGCLWVAIWGGWAVHRYDSTGRLVQEIAIPVAQPSSCAFASDGTLVVTSARAGLSPDDLDAQPLAGSVFAVDTDTQGVPIAAFAG